MRNNNIVVIAEAEKQRERIIKQKLFFDELFV